MQNEMSCQTARQSRESFVEETEWTALWTRNLDNSDPGKIDEQSDELIQNDILYSYVPHEKYSAGWGMDYMTGLDAERLVKDNIEVAVEIFTRRFVTIS